MLPRLKNNIPAISGVYKLINSVTGEAYVGSSTDIRHRWNYHRTQLRNGTHTERLAKAAEEYGWQVFEIQILEEVQDKSLLLSREQYWLDVINPVYNGSRFSDTLTGTVLLERSRKRISEGHKGILPTKEHKEKVQAWRNTPENKERIGRAISKAKTGFKFSEESKLLMSNTRKGKPWSQARREAQHKRRVKNASNN